MKCPEKTCSESYLEETVRRINKTVLEHAGKDMSHMLRYTLSSDHLSVSPNEFKTLGKSFNIDRIII